MALKGIIFSALLGAAGTTTAAIPIAGKYGKGRVEEEKDKALEHQAGLKEANNALLGEKGKADKLLEQAKTAKQNAENKKTNLKKNNESLEQQRDAQKRRADEQTQKYNQWKRDYDAEDAKNKDLQQKLGPLRNENASLKEQLKGKDEEINRARREQQEKVVNYVDDRLSGRVQFNFAYDHSDRAIHTQFNQSIAYNPTKPWEQNPQDWNCRQYTDLTTFSHLPFGIAYCAM